MKTLERQLADYGERQKELHGPISPDELAVTLGQSDQKAPLPPHRRQGLWIAVTAAAATLVVFGLIPLLLNTDTPSSAADTAATTPSVAPTTPLSVVPPTIPNDERVGREGYQNMFGVTVGGPGLVAVGATGGWFGVGDAAVWTSVDGITWTRVTHDENVFGGANSQTMWDVTVGGPGLVAVGHDGHGILDDVSDVDAAVWTSVDGVTWLRVPHDEEVFGRAWMESVTVGGPGLVAVGGTDGYFTDGDAVVWTSTDGITWSRVPHDESIFGGNGGQPMSSPTATKLPSIALNTLLPNSASPSGTRDQVTPSTEVHAASTSVPNPNIPPIAIRPGPPAVTLHIHAPLPKTSTSLGTRVQVIPSGDVHTGVSTSRG